MRARFFYIAAVIAVLVGGWQATVHQKKAQTMESAVVAKDAAGGDTTKDLAALQTYVHGHMTTSAKVFLANAFNQAAAQAQAAANPQSNGQIYGQAQAACASKADSIVQAHCVTAYVNSHSQPSTNPQAVAPPKKDDYTKSFHSPLWTLDSTGIALLLAAILALAGWLDSFFNKI